MAKEDRTEDQIEGPETDGLEVEARLMAEGPLLEDRPVFLAMADLCHPGTEAEEEEEEVEARPVAEALPLSVLLETPGTASGNSIVNFISTSCPNGMGIARLSLPIFARSWNLCVCRLR
jgi:hypothetical protein